LSMISRTLPSLRNYHNEKECTMANRYGEAEKQRSWLSAGNSQRA
jgi:hypothetical protein